MEKRFRIISINSLLIISFFLLYNSVNADIAPNPIIAKGIYTLDSCNIQLISEVVNIDLFYDSSKIDCSFELFNHGDSTIIEVGFPEMNFEYWAVDRYSEIDKSRFNILVDNKLLSEEEILVPKEIDTLYKAYLYYLYLENGDMQKVDSINKIININNIDYTAYGEIKPNRSSDFWYLFYEQREEGNIPWYVWKLSFKKGETKTINLSYTLPFGATKKKLRYFKYLLNTGAGWFGKIQKADIIVKLHDMEFKDIEEKYPSKWIKNKKDKTLIWEFIDFEPTNENDILIRYYKKSIWDILQR